MSLLGTALTFLVATFRPATDEQISAGVMRAPDQTAPVVPQEKPAPRSRAEVQKVLVEQFIEALRIRPNDFQEGAHTLDDKVTGMEWWIANGAEHFRLSRVEGCGCQNLRTDCARREQFRAWEAIETWRAGAGALNSPHAHEAMRLWEANQKALRRG